MGSHYVLILVQKNDAWAPGCTRNPETYILKDQVPILFVITFVFLQGHMFHLIFSAKNKFCKENMIVDPKMELIHILSFACACSY